MVRTVGRALFSRVWESETQHALFMMGFLRGAMLGVIVGWLLAIWL